MKKLVTLIAVLLAAALGYYQQHPSAPAQPQLAPVTTSLPQTSAGAAHTDIEQAIAERRSDVQIAFTATVKKLLKDDNKGSRHQRFVVELPSGNTVLVAHNIDLAERINTLQPGDQVALYGEYEWNELGGVLHWTHHDPAGRHVGGWIKHQGRTYQ